MRRGVSFDGVPVAKAAAAPGNASPRLVAQTETHTIVSVNVHRHSVDQNGNYYVDGVQQQLAVRQPTVRRWFPSGRARYIYPDSGYPGEAERARELLLLGAAYTVHREDIGSSSSRVQFVECPGQWFNTVHFSDAGPA